MDNNFKIEIKDFRAIKEASIIIDGITVIAGENGSGKSTISKLLYHTIKSSMNYDKIVVEKSNRDLYKIFELLDILIRELFILDTDKYTFLRRQLKNVRSKNFHQIELFDEDNSLTNLINLLIEQIYDFQNKKASHNELYQNRINRIKRMLIDEIFYIKNSNKADLKEIDKLSFNDLLKQLLNKINNILEQLREYKEKRPISFYYNILNEVFYDNPISKTFNIFEYGVPILDNKDEKLNEIHTIHNIAYIDTPMIIGIPTFAERTHWDDLNELLEKKQRTKKSDILDILKKDIIKGEISNEYDEFNDKNFVYKREDGAEFDLLECATGLKSFAIIQILHKNGLLDNKSLLIIDEPEAHLHPQWVVEYARLIVLLNKKLGVKFLIASHHPDMISAIKYISLKEKTDKSLNFYLAEKNKNNPFLYNYKHKKIDLEDIFASFNIAFERIDLYGKTE